MLAGDRTEPLPAIGADEPPRAAPAAGTGTAAAAAGARGAPPPAGAKRARPAGAKRARPAGAKRARPAGKPVRAAAAPAAGSPRGRRRLAWTATATAAVLIAAVAVAARHPGRPRPAPGLLSSPPVTRLAAKLPSRPGEAGPAGPAEISQVVASGPVVAAFGSQAGQPLILVSADGGRTWRSAALAARPEPAPGGAPVLAAGGRGRWLALSEDGSWTSRDGLSWAPGPPLAPMAAGDRVLALARAAGGFVAVGENVSGRHRAVSRRPVVWTSADGFRWRRRAGRRLALRAPGGRPGALRWAAGANGVILVGGDVARVRVERRGHRTVRIASTRAGMWRSADAGARWSAARLPAGHGAGARLAGVAAAGSGFVAVRPGRTATGRRVAVAYFSRDGASWRRAGLLEAPRSLRIDQVAGSGDGAVAVGAAGGREVAFVTSNGRRWRRTAFLGRARAAGVTAAAAAPGRLALVAGSAGAGGGTAPSRAHARLLLAGARLARVGQAALAAAAHPENTIAGLAESAGRWVAVGSAGGAPGLWTRSPGRPWSLPAAGLPPAGWLASVAHARAGWLAVGGQRPARGGRWQPGPMIGAFTPGQDRPLALTSSGGRAWRAVPAPGGPGASLAQAAAGPAGYIVVGSQTRGGQTVAAAWRSADLTAWTPLAWTAGGAVSAPSAMLAVAAGAGGFVAVGGIGQRPAVWAASGGQALAATVLPVPPGAAAAALTRVAMAGRVVVALGQAEARPAQAPAGRSIGFAAVSRDGGRTWSESLLPAAGGAGPPTALTAVPGGFVAAGQDGAGATPNAVFWWSANGARWHAVPSSDEGAAGAQVVTALAASGGSLAAVGYETSGAGRRPLQWAVRLR